MTGGRPVGSSVVSGCGHLATIGHPATQHGPASTSIVSARVDVGATVAESALRHVDHRPWPVPATPWVMRMRWCDLLFAHWRVEPEQVRALLPRGLDLDLFDGEAWLGVVPLRMTRVAPRYCPDVPGLSSFAELNLRTYVRVGGQRGVWFFTLEAESRLAVWAGRSLFHLPYNYARMRCAGRGSGVEFASERTDPTSGMAAFRGTYMPRGEPFRTSPGSLEEWLTERYCLYASRKDGALYRGEIHHAPWPLQPAEAEIEMNELPAAYGLKVEDHSPLLHFAAELNVVAWAPVRVRGTEQCE